MPNYLKMPEEIASSRPPGARLELSPHRRVGSPDVVSMSIGTNPSHPTIACSLSPTSSRRRTWPA